VIPAGWRLNDALLVRTSAEAARLDLSHLHRGESGRFDCERHLPDHTGRQLVPARVGYLPWDGIIHNRDGKILLPHSRLSRPVCLRPLIIQPFGVRPEMVAIIT